MFTTIYHHLKTVKMTLLSPNPSTYTKIKSSTWYFPNEKRTFHIWLSVRNISKPTSHAKFKLHPLSGVYRRGRQRLNYALPKFSNALSSRVRGELARTQIYPWKEAGWKAAEVVPGTFVLTSWNGEVGSPQSTGGANGVHIRNSSHV